MPRNEAEGACVSIVFDEIRYLRTLPHRLTAEPPLGGSLTYNVFFAVISTVFVGTGVSTVRKSHGFIRKSVFEIIITFSRGTIPPPPLRYPPEKAYIIRIFRRITGFSR